MKALAAAAAALLAAAAPAAAQPQGLSVADFLARAQALMMAGQVAPDNAELAVLRGEIVAAGKAVRAQQAADRAAGRPATYCIPAEARADASEIVQHLQKIPAARRGVPFRQAFAEYARAKYPCPAR